MNNIEKIFLCVLIINLLISTSLIFISAKEYKTNNDLDNNKILHFNFNKNLYNEISGIIYDLSGNRNNGFIKNAKLNPNGPKNNWALDFNGYNESLIIQNQDSLSPSNYEGFSISFWVKFKNTKFTGKGKYKDYIDFISKGNKGNYEFSFRQHNSSNQESRSNRISFYLFNKGGGQGSGSFFQEDINTDEWVHIVGVFNKDEIDIYKNGILKDKTPLNQYNVLPEKGEALLIIGGEKGFHFNGSISRIEMFNKSLNQAEILEIYDNNY